MIIRNIQDAKTVNQTSAATSYEKLSQHFAAAEQKYILPVLGAEMYQKVNQYIDNEGFIFLNGDFPKDFKSKEPDVAAEKNHYYASLIWQLRNAVFHLAYYMGFNMLNAYVSDGGFKRTETDRIKSLFKYQEYSLRRYFRDTGFSAIDLSLEILQENIHIFPEFFDMDNELRSQIIPSAKVFDQHYNINNSRLTFLSLKPHMRAVETFDVLPIMGKQNMETVITELQTQPSPKVLAILPYIINPIAYLSTALLMEESGASIGEHGLYFIEAPGTDELVPANENRIKELVARNKKIGSKYLSQLSSYLRENDRDWVVTFSPRGRDYAHDTDNSGRRAFWA